MSHTRVISFLILILFLSMNFTQLPTAKGVEADLQDNEFEAIFEPEVRDDNTFNIAEDQAIIPTGYGSWEDDWGEDIPQGIFLGPAIEPVTFYTGVFRTYKRCYMELEQSYTFTATEIMNGVSQFWVKAPIVWDDLLYLHDTTWPTWSLILLIDDTIVTTENMFILGDGLYMRMEHLLFPDVEYNFKFRIPFEWWEISEIPERGYYHDKPPAILITGENLGNGLGTAKYKFWTTSESDPYILPNYDGSLTGIDDISIVGLPDEITLATTFIFTKGIGQGGLFGRTYQILSNENIPGRAITNPDGYSTFNMVTELSYNTDSDIGKVSMIIPFDSPDPVTLLWVKIFISSQWILSGLAFQEFNANIDYSGFFIFTLPETLTLATIDNGGSKPNEGVIPVQVTISIRNSKSYPGSITLLHDSSPGSYWSQVQFYDYDNEDGWYRTLQGMKTNLDTTDLSYTFDYNPVIYAEMTDDIWALVTTDYSTGSFTYTKAFQTKIYIPVHVYEIYRENEDGGYDQVYVGYDEGEYEQALAEYGVLGFDNDREPLSYLEANLYNGVKAIWNGLKTMYGYIVDGLQRGFDLLLQLGEFEIKALMSIRDIIRSIITFIQENVVSILELIWIVIGPFLALFMLVTSSKFLKMTLYKEGPV